MSHNEESQSADSSSAEQPQASHKIRLRDSIVVRLGMVMVMIALMSFISIFLSLRIADKTVGKADAINLSGSLRMMSYRMLSEAQSEANRAVLLESIREFEERIDALGEFVQLRERDNRKLPGSYETVKALWNDSIRSRLLNIQNTNDPESFEDLRGVITNFVGSIDNVVILIVEDLERNISLLRSVQMTLLTLIVIVCALSTWMITSMVVKPFKHLLEMAQELRQRNFKVRADYIKPDELGQLGQAFNLMTVELSRVYDQQERTIRSKAEELITTNRSLELLYKTALHLSDHELTIESLHDILCEVEAELQIGHGAICVREGGYVHAHRLVCNFTPDEIRVLCSGRDCDRCFHNTSTARSTVPGYAFAPIQAAGEISGVMPFCIPDGNFPSWKRLTLETIGHNLSVALGKRKRLEERRRMAVLEERSVIARELHDSIAQSLSYLRIQVTRLEKLGSQDPEYPEVLQELKGGLVRTYRELRELITAFRLKVGEQGFQIALQDAVDEFSKRCNVRIHYENRLTPPLTLSANEEIHVLRIVREALANIEKHAHASAIGVFVGMINGGKIEVLVKDNGVGVTSSDSPAHHYGLTIMKDRAHTLGGEITIEAATGGGTEVCLRFVPAKLLADAETAKVQSNMETV